MSNNEEDRLNQAMEEALQSVLLREGASAPNSETETSKSPMPPSSDPPAGHPPAQEEPSFEAKELRDQLMRLAADFENFRKRTRREQEEARQYGIEKLLHDLLPALDNLDRALGHSTSETNPLIEGVSLVARQFADILTTYGVSSFESINQPFDPEKHEAIGQVSTTEVPLGYVVEEVQKGYLLHDRLLRPARVLVATAPSPTANSDAEKPEPTS
mgnify:CR=1 FL=1